MRVLVFFFGNKFENFDNIYVFLCVNMIIILLEYILYICIDIVLWAFYVYLVLSDFERSHPA